MLSFWRKHDYAAAAAATKKTIGRTALPVSQRQASAARFL